MSFIKTVLAGFGLATVGYGAYKGAQYLIENSGSSSGDCDDEISDIIEKAREQAEAEFADVGLDEGAVS